jgi:hypothetical protein
MKTSTRHALPLILLMGIFALLAQVAGVGGTSSTRSGAAAGKTLATIAGGSVPDIGSTKLASAKRTADQDEVVQMHGEADVVARSLGKSGVVQVVCGLRYARDGDRSWTLGTPYETVSLTRAKPREHVTIDRSFAAPARDTYRVSVACHRSSPGKGVKVTATGATQLELGLPAGAATPVE